MSFKAKRKVIFAKIETTYGTDSVPVVGTDAMLVHNFNVVPVALRYVERDPALHFFGNDGQIKVGESMTVQFDVEQAGAGGVATVPKFGPLLRACAHAETVTPTTGPVTYAPITTAEESASLHFNRDGLLHKVLGMRGNVEWVWSGAQIPMLRFTFEGLYGGVTDAALAAPTLTGWQRPLGMNKVNTTFALHGFAAVLREMRVNQGNAMQYVNLPNLEEVRFTDRKTRGSVTIELPTIAARDFFTTCRNETTGAIALTHGTAAGNRAIFSASTVQLTSPQYSEADGKAVLTMGMELRHSGSGNNEYSFATQ